MGDSLAVQSNAKPQNSFSYQFCEIEFRFRLEDFQLTPSNSTSSLKKNFFAVSPNSKKTTLIKNDPRQLHFQVRFTDGCREWYDLFLPCSMSCHVTRGGVVERLWKRTGHGNSNSKLWSQTWATPIGLRWYFVARIRVLDKTIKALLDSWRAAWIIGLGEKWTIYRGNRFVHSCDPITWSCWKFRSGIIVEFLREGSRVVTRIPMNCIGCYTSRCVV